MVARAFPRLAVLPAYKQAATPGSGWAYSLKLATNPLNGTSFVTNEQLQLLNLSDFETFAIVFANLFREEVHPISLREALTQAGIEFRGGQGYTVSTLNMEGNHSVEEKITLPLSDDLSSTRLRDKDWDLMKMRPDKLPSTNLRTGD